MKESEFITLMRTLADHPAARALDDDVAVLEIGGTRLVLTHDMIVEGVHYRSDDPPGDVAWKLVAVNLSDLAAKGARPLGVLLGYALGEEEWDRSFAAGFAQALAGFALPLLGGDTVAPGEGRTRTLGLTALGIAAAPPPARSGARPGDRLWVTGTIGDAAAGLEALDSGRAGGEALVERYRLPRPRIEAGAALAPLASAMMDVSDGLLIDAARLAQASGCRARIALEGVPISEALAAAWGEDREARLRAATGGDDYELLLAADPEHAVEILEIGESLGLSITPIGDLDEGAGLALEHRGKPVALPDRLGFEHRG